MIVALAGGVGGAKLAQGLARALSPRELTVVVNTGDDFEHCGLHVSPDLDTVMYTLAGVGNTDAGWGLAGESWICMDALERLGGPGWFRLGDRDLATHLERTRRAIAGEPLSAITQTLCARLGVKHSVLPMSNDSVRTIVHTETGELEFQHYFVRERCEPQIRRLEYRGAGTAHASPGLLQALQAPGLEGVIICPSNPYLSVAPILALGGVREALARSPRVLAVSPIVGGRAIKGPAAKIMRELGADATAYGVADYYRGMIGMLVIDRTDAALAPQIEGLGMRVAVTDAVMRNAADRERLARECIALLRARTPAL